MLANSEAHFLSIVFLTPRLWMVVKVSMRKKRRLKINYRRVTRWRLVAGTKTENFGLHSWVEEHRALSKKPRLTGISEILAVNINFWVKNYPLMLMLLRTMPLKILPQWLTR